MSRASNLVQKMLSWTETDWLLLRHHYPEDVARFAVLLMDGPPRESEGPEDPGAGTDDTRVCDGECWRGRPMVSEVSSLVSAHRDYGATDPSVHLSQTVQLVFDLFRGRAETVTEAARDARPGESDRDPVVEGPAPLSELPSGSAPMLQLRRDVQWLRDRGCRGQSLVSRFTIAEMVGLGHCEFDSLSAPTRQKFENRAYTALRTLNGGAR